MDEAQASDPGRRDHRTSEPSPTKAVTGGEGRARRETGGWRAARWARRAVQIACFATFVYLLFAGLQRHTAQPFTDIFFRFCLLYTSDAADDLLCVDLGGRR